MSDDHDELLEGPHSLGAERTIDLETLLAVSHIIGHLGTSARWSMQPDLVDSLSRALRGGAFHHPDFEFRIDEATATIDQKREELDRCLSALRQQLRRINQQGA